MYEKLKRCPFCGSDSVGIGHSLQNNEELTKHYFAECISCACLGPESLDENEARQLWQNRRLSSSEQPPASDNNRYATALDVCHEYEKEFGVTFVSRFIGWLNSRLNAEGHSA